MHLVYSLLCALFALYVSGFASATTDPAAAEKPAPHIALLLPLSSPSLGAAAESVHQGILAAASLQSQGLPLRVYADYDEARGVLPAYRSAVANGAVAVLGPLTRGGIRQLCDEKTLPVPTLALNIVEGAAPAQLYFFGMAVEAEAKQIALLARKQGMKQAIVIAGHDPLAQRLQFAFEEQWNASGGTILREIEYKGDAMIFADIAPAPDTMAFFSTDIETSRAIRPYLPNSLAAYSTSQLFSGNRNTLTNFDFSDIRFVDMPWLMQSELPSVAAYPRASRPLSTDGERLYALGIDAYRLLRLLQSSKNPPPLAGVTGRVSLSGHTFWREALPSVFVQGRAQPADAPVAPAAQLFPDQFKNASAVDAVPVLKK